jgi:hypothetical protein
MWYGGRNVMLMHVGLIISAFTLYWKYVTMKTEKFCRIFHNFFQQVACNIRTPQKVCQTQCTQNPEGHIILGNFLSHRIYEKLISRICWLKQKLILGQRINTKTWAVIKKWFSTHFYRVVLKTSIDPHWTHRSLLCRLYSLPLGFYWGFVSWFLYVGVANNLGCLN